jgi:hypothetical protein
MNKVKRVKVVTKISNELRAKIDKLVANKSGDEKLEILMRYCPNFDQVLDYCGIKQDL